MLIGNPNALRVGIVGFLCEVVEKLVDGFLLPVTTHEAFPTEVVTMTHGLHAGMSLREMAEIFRTNTISDMRLKNLRHPCSFAYMLGLHQLFPQNKSKRHARLFQRVFDLDSEFSNPGDVDAQVLVTAGLHPVAQSIVQGALKRATESVVNDYCQTLPLLEEIIADAQPDRLRVSARNGRQQTLVQRALQSGDSNGMAFALTCFPHINLLFVLDHDEIPAASSILTFYRAMGVLPERIRVSVVYATQDEVDPYGAQKALGEFTSSRIDALSYPGGAGGLYQHVVNTNYIKNDPYALFFIDAYYGLAETAFSEVGASTEQVRRFVVSDPQNHAKISQTIHEALDACVESEARSKIHMFGDRFLSSLAEHYVKKGEKVFQPSEVVEGSPYVVLCWVRGPQGDEGKHVESRTDNGLEGRYVPTVGKPWHHATRQLLTTLRQLSYELARELRAPVYFVPIGDVPKSDFHHLLSGNESQAKAAKEYNLIEFFKKLPEFQNRNRFNQLYFLHDLFRRTEARFVQVGLRSGAIEQGMYLGMPTVYIDIETESIQKIKPGETDTTMRMLKMTSSKSGFPMFHCLFSKNVIGVYPRQKDEDTRGVLKQFTLESIKGITRKEEPTPLLQGTLNPEEIEQMFKLLRQLYEAYPDHMRALKLWR